MSGINAVNPERAVVNEFLDNVEKLAKDAGLDAFVVIPVKTWNDPTKLQSRYIISEENKDSIIVHDNVGLFMKLVEKISTDVTFAEVYDYFRDLEYDGDQNHEMFPDEFRNLFIFSCMDDRRFSICRKDELGRNWYIGHFHFEDKNEAGVYQTVRIIPVNNDQIADYGTNFRFDIHTSLRYNDGWAGCFGSVGEEIKKALIEFMNM